MQSLQADRTYCPTLSYIAKDFSPSSSSYQAINDESGWSGSSQDGWCRLFSMQQAGSRGSTMLGNAPGAAACRTAQETTIGHVSRQSQAAQGIGIHQSWVLVPRDGADVQPRPSNDAEAVYTPRSTYKAGGGVYFTTTSTTSAVRSHRTCEAARSRS